MNTVTCKICTSESDKEKHLPTITTFEALLFTYLSKSPPLPPPMSRTEKPLKQLMHVEKLVTFEHCAKSELILPNC
jgi:hypothetical protein